MLRVRAVDVQGRPLVLVHGILGAASTWDGVLSELGPDVRAVVPELLGFGASPRPSAVDDLWADAQARALGRALDELGIARAAFAAHDFGGPVAVSLARQRPELFSHLALCATNVLADTPIPMPIAAVTWPLAGRVAERLLFSGPSLRMTLRRGVGEPPVALDAEAYLGDGDQRRAIRLLFATALRELERRYAPVAEALGRLDVPVLVAWGDRDPFFSVEQGRRTAAAIPGARFELYEGCGHFVPEERPERLAADLRTLLGLAPAGGARRAPAARAAR